jgi:hypothetical protein
MNKKKLLLIFVILFGVNVYFKMKKQNISYDKLPNFLQDHALSMLFEQSISLLI